MIPSEDAVPHVSIYRERVEFVGKHNNMSILLWNITFEDGGEYTCFGRNPKEKGKNHSATIKLIVVDECELSPCVSFIFLLTHTCKQSLWVEKYLNHYF